MILSFHRNLCDTDIVSLQYRGITIIPRNRPALSRSQKDWDEYLPYLLFAYCEVPQETTGFSPFDLLYGLHVRGPLDVLREGWTGDKEAAVPVNTYVVEMRQQLADMAQLVVEHSSRSQEKQKL